MGDSLDPGAGDTQAVEVPQAPVEKVVNYLRFVDNIYKLSHRNVLYLSRRVVPVILEDGAETVASLDAALADKSALDLIRKFIGDATCSSLLVQRTAIREDDEDDTRPGEEKEIVMYQITSTVHYNQVSLLDNQ